MKILILFAIMAITLVNYCQNDSLNRIITIETIEKLPDKIIFFDCGNDNILYTQCSNQSDNYLFPGGKEKINSKIKIVLDSLGISNSFNTIDVVFGLEMDSIGIIKTVWFLESNNSYMLENNLILIKELKDII